MNAQVLGEISKMNEQEIFMAAARIENRDSRDDYLSEVCGDNVPLRRRVEALLAARERDDSLLDQPVARFEPTVGMAPN